MAGPGSGSTTLVSSSANSNENAGAISLLPEAPEGKGQLPKLPKEILNFHDLYTFDSDNNPVYFHSFIGKIVLVTNIATQCFSAYQLRQFEALYQKFKHQGFVILAFPSNQFHQEIKGTDQHVAAACRKKFEVSFPIMQKVKVNGKEQCAVFKFLKENKRGFLHTRRVKWNFEKFLVGRDGTILKRYSTREKVSNIIEKDLLKIIGDEEFGCGQAWDGKENEKERRDKKVQSVYVI